MEWIANIKTEWVVATAATLILVLGLLRILRVRSSRFEALAPIEDGLRTLTAVLVTVFLVIRPYVFQTFYVASGSMEPTLNGPDGNRSSGQSSGGDRCIVDKLVYFFSNPARGEIAVFRAPTIAAADEKEFIKRVIGVPGDTVEVVPPRVLLDGKVFLKVAEQSGLPFLAGGRAAPAVEANGARMRFGPEFNDAGLLLVASRGGKVESDGFKVEVDGREVLSDPKGRIRPAGPLEAIGAAPAQSGAVFKIGEEARLAIAPGATLSFEQGHVRVNGRVLDEPYIAERPRYEMPPRYLGAEEYFVMGDNRNQSNDSHVWGPVRRERFLGRAEIVMWPLGRLRLHHWLLLAVLGAAFGLYALFQRLWDLLGSRKRVTV